MVIEMSILLKFVQIHDAAGDVMKSIIINFYHRINKSNNNVLFFMLKNNNFFLKIRKTLKSHFFSVYDNVIFLNKILKNLKNLLLLSKNLQKILT